MAIMRAYEVASMHISKSCYIVERQAQHRPDRLEEAEDRIGWDRLVRPSTRTGTQTGAKEGRFGAETGRPLGKIFCREYILGFSVNAH